MATKRPWASLGVLGRDARIPFTLQNRGGMTRFSFFSAIRFFCAYISAMTDESMPYQRLVTLNVTVGLARVVFFSFSFQGQNKEDRIAQ